MKVKQYLNLVAEVKKSEIDDGMEYVSKYDGSYITRVGMENDIEFLAKREITEHLTHGVGLSLLDGKWYGWSHRAIYGFKIGSTCKKGDCHYNGCCLDEQKEDAIRFWEDECHENVRCDGIIEKNGDRYFDIKWDYNDKTPNKKLHMTIGGAEHHIKDSGRGEWTAKSEEDAKQMAIDFNEGVS